MEFFESMSFTYAILISAAVAFVLSIAPGYLMFRRRKKARIERSRPVYSMQPAVVDSYRSSEPLRMDEISGLATALESTVGKIEESVMSCLEMCDRLLVEGRGVFDKNRVGGSTGSGYALREKIADLKSSGLGGSDIAERLRLDSELVRLYMHTGTKTH